MIVWYTIGHLILTNQYYIQLAFISPIFCSSVFILFYLEKLNLNYGCIRLWSRGLLTLYASNQGQSNNGLGLNQPVIFYECMLFCLRNVCSLSPRKFSVRFWTAMGSSAATCFFSCYSCRIKSSGKVYLAFINLLLDLETSTTKDYWI